MIFIFEVTTTALTKCSVCQNQSPTYCVLFKITNPILQENGQNVSLYFICLFPYYYIRLLNICIIYYQPLIHCTVDKVV